MCWSINKKKFDKDSEKYHHIAEEDMTVYKIGYVSEKDNCFHPCFKEYFSYKPNVLNDEIRVVLVRGRKNSYSIHEGYHSYDNEKKAFDNLWFYKDMCELNSLINGSISNICIEKFIIPKGSVYYENEDNEIVSSQLVWTGGINMDDNE